MKQARGKAVAIATLVLGLAVLAAAGLVFSERISEERRRWSRAPGGPSLHERLDGVDYLPPVPRG